MKQQGYFAYKHVQIVETQVPDGYSVLRLPRENRLYPVSWEKISCAGGTALVYCPFYRGSVELAGDPVSYGNTPDGLSQAVALLLACANAT